MEHAERSGPLASRGKRGHQAGMGGLVEAIVRAQLAKPRQRPVRDSRARRHVGVPQHRVPPPLGQFGHRWMPVQQVHVGQHLTPPQSQRLFVQAAGGLQVALCGGRVRAPGQLAERGQVEPAAAGLQPVAGAGRADRARTAAGWYQIQLGDYELARGNCQQALTMFRQAGSQYGVAHTLDSLGYAYFRLGDYGQAVSCFKQALSTFSETGDHLNRVDTLAHLVETYLATGNQRAADQARQRALAILDDLHHADAAVLRAKL
jgi:Tetratricopeptide repeat